MKSTLHRALAFFIALVLIWSAAAAATPGMRYAGSLLAAGETDPSEPASEPLTTEPTTIEPTTIEPTTIEPTTIEPTTIEPTTIEPTTIEPTTIEPLTTEPLTTEPLSTEPATQSPCDETGHVPGAWTPAPDGKHTSVCTVGGAPLEGDCEYASPAVFTPLGNGTHARLCLLCGAPDTPAPCGFDGGAAVPPAQDTPGGILYTCAACGYQTFTETAPAEKDRTESRLLGDADLSGSVEPADARLILRASLSLQSLPVEALPYADLNGDGDIAPGDARLALRVSLLLQDADRHEISAAFTETPTCTAAGSLAWTCVYCGASGTIAAPQNAHEWVDATPQKAKYCGVCNLIVPGWQKVGNDDYYFLPDGTPPAGGRLQRGTLKGKNANWYIADGKAQHGFTGFFKYDGAEWYIENGAVNDTVAALVNVNGARKYVTGGKVAETVTGLVNAADGRWYVINGVVDASYKGLVSVRGVKWYIENGKVNEAFTGLKEISGGFWYIKNGAVDETYTGFVTSGEKQYYVKNGAADKTLTGLVTVSGKQYYLKNGAVAAETSGLVTISGQKWYLKNGVVDTSFIGLITSDGKDLYVKNGKPDASFTGVVNWKNENRYVHGGVADRTWRGAVTLGGTDWVVEDGVAVKVTSTYDRTLFRAFKEVEKAVAAYPNYGDKLEDKLTACFVYCKHYTERRPRTPHYTGWDWPLLYANDMFAGSGGNCCSYGAAFAFMAKALGYTESYACNSSGHGWAEVNGRVYDPEWSKRDGLNAVTYFNLSYDTNCGVDYKTVRSWWVGDPSSNGWMHIKIARSSFN